jgi:hypothetical protein
VDAYDRVNEMFDHVDFRECRRVVMVGCGRRPFTMFHIHDKTDVPEIVGLDIVPEALEAGEALAGRLGYDRARFVLCDGIAYDFGGADLVYVSAMVSPKAAVVSRIVDTAPGHVHITVREPYALGRLWSESAVRPLDPRLEIAGSGSGAWSLSRDVHLKRRP